MLSFQMEVRVRASGALFEQPSSCLKTKEVCSFLVNSERLHLDQKALKFHAPEGSVLVRMSDKLWRFVKGTLWVEQGAGIEVESVYGSFMASQGQYWIIEKDSKILIRNMDAELTVTLRDGKKLNVPSGFEFWISGLNTMGESEYGMIQPINMKDHLPLWYSLYEGNKENFITEVRHLRDHWGDLVEKSSFIYKKLVLRELASIHEKEEVQRIKKERMEFQRQQIQKIYYQRVFER